mmetsp:Transcript_27819/g.45939  ORF Transcript_27819/g.45939 Transcript_27819/m.45939 type:complete len:200 (-) Transcript_27819:310-909(-)
MVDLRGVNTSGQGVQPGRRSRRPILFLPLVLEALVGSELFICRLAAKCCCQVLASLNRIHHFVVDQLIEAMNQAGTLLLRHYPLGLGAGFLHALQLCMCQGLLLVIHEALCVKNTISLTTKCFKPHSLAGLQISAHGQSILILGIGIHEELTITHWQSPERARGIQTSNRRKGNIRTELGRIESTKGRCKKPWIALKDI